MSEKINNFENFGIKENNKETNEKGDKKDKNVILVGGTQIETNLRFLSGLIEDRFSDSCEVDILNLGTKTGEMSGEYSPEIKKEVIDFIIKKRPDLLGASIIDYEEDRLFDLLKEIKGDKEIEKIGTKIIIGGPQVIEFPERYLKKDGVDIACYSTGWNFPDVVEAVGSGNDLENIPGLMYEGEDGSIVKTDVPDLNVSLSEQPLPDWSLENTYKINKNRLKNMSKSGGSYPVEHHQIPHRHTGVLVLSEGCPNNCEFCHIGRRYKKMKELNNGEKVRKHDYLSAERSIELIKSFLKNNPKTEYILFNDNDFSARPPRKAKELMDIYKEEIKIPFYCQCSPNTLSKKHIQHYIDSGCLDMIEIGVQGSYQSNVNAGYKRLISDDKVKDFARNTGPYIERKDSQGNIKKDGIKIGMDFINGNPKHTKEDILGTIKLMEDVTEIVLDKSENKGNWNVVMHNLTLDPDVELARKNAEINNSTVGDVGKSDYHNAELTQFFQKCSNEFYLNILLEWLNGVHDKDKIGKLPRKSEKFLELVKNVLDGDDNFKNLLISLAKDKSLTIDLLTNDEIYSYLNSENGKKVLEKINTILPKTVRYSYQRKNRYEYNYNQ